jgi:hypothetical protein
MHCTYNITSRHDRELLLLRKSNKYYIFACVRVNASARACAYVHVALLIWHTMCMHHIVSSFLASLATPHFLTSSHKRHDFREKVIEHQMYALIFSTTFV